MEKKEITVFDFGGKDLRTLVVNGDPWFVAKDVCDVLQLRTNNIRSIVNSEDVSNDYHIVIGSKAWGGKPPLIINESGLYTLIFRSNKKEAKAFTRWVTKEVLPTIRKTGGYIAPIERITPDVDAIMKESSANHQKWLDTVKDNLSLAKKNSVLKTKIANTITKDDFLSLKEGMVTKEDFSIFKEIVFSELQNMAHKTQSPRVLREELKVLVKRYATKNNFGDKYVWGELYAELGKTYHVSITNKVVGKNKLDIVSDYGLLPKSIEMVKSWIEEEEASISDEDLLAL